MKQKQNVKQNEKEMIMNAYTVNITEVNDRIHDTRSELLSEDDYLRAVRASLGRKITSAFRRGQLVDLENMLGKLRQIRYTPIAPECRELVYCLEYKAMTAANSVRAVLSHQQVNAAGVGRKHTAAPAA